MISLGIDTSLAAASFAVLKDGKLLAAKNADVGRDLADKISEITKGILEEAKVEIDEVRRLGIVVGPGSFTGLRIGIAFAKGLFFCDGEESRTKVAPVSSLECVARTSVETGNIAVFWDARQGEVFFARFNNENGTFTRLSQDERILRQEALEKCEKNDRIIEITEDFGENRGEVAAKIASLAEEKTLTSIDKIFPNYMQVSYAELKKRPEGGFCLLAKCSAQARQRCEK